MTVRKEERYMKLEKIDQFELAKILQDKLMKYGEFDESTCYDIAFHMTDWLVDMKELKAFYESPDDYNPDDSVGLLASSV